MRFNKHCTCSPKSSGMICKYCSRIRMVILLKKGKAIVRYSIYSKNNQDDTTIANDLWRRTENTAAIKSIYSQINKILIYDNLMPDKPLIAEFTGW